MSSIGVPGVILLLILALLLFGPNKLPELGRAVGRTMREFKAGARSIMDDDDVQSSSRKEVSASDRQSAPAVQAPPRVASSESSRQLPE